MDDISSLWTFHEVEELKEKVQYMTYELEITRKEANEEMRKKNEHVKKLLHLLQTVMKERDEAKSQLQKLEQQQILPSFNNNNNNNQFIPATGPFSPDSPLLTNYPNRTNSGITESNNSLSFETTNNTNNNNNSNNNQNRVSSPVVDSISVSHPRATSSSDSSNIGLSTLATPMSTPTGANKVVVVDQATMMIDNLAKGKARPQKGKLLQAVLEAGPLLQTLLVAGSLPRWRNPPGSLTAHPIPPVNIKGCVTSVVGGVANTKSNVGEYNGQFGSIGVCPSSILDFGSASSGSCLMGGRFINSGLNFDSQIPKRQRLM